MVVGAIIALFIFCIIIFDDSEGFELSGVEFQLFSIAGADSTTGCTKLIAETDSGMHSIIGLRFKTRRVSRTLRAFTSILSEKTEEIRYDSIKSLTVINEEQVIENVTGIKLNEFTVPNSTNMNNHSINLMTSCYQSNYFRNIRELQGWYNGLKWHDPAIRNFSFYDFETLRRVKGKLKVRIRLEMYNGKVYLSQ